MVHLFVNWMFVVYQHYKECGWLLSTFCLLEQVGETPRHVLEFQSIQIVIFILKPPLSFKILGLGDEDN